MKAGVYVRCSTDMQEDSTDDQLALIRRYCKRESHPIVSEYVDEAVSGGIPIAQRPAARRMLDDAKAHKFECIVVKQLERLGRNAADSISFLELVKRLNIQLLFVHESYADTPAGRLNYNIVAVISQFYRENIGQLIKDHNLERARRGLWRGGTPALGLMLDKETGRLIANPATVEAINLLFESYVRNNGSREATARELNRMGIPSPGGELWVSIKVKRLLRNPIFLGRQTYAGNEYEIDVPEIVPRDLVLQARKLLEATQGKKVKCAPNGAYPYTHIAHCGKCGGYMWCAHPCKPSRGITPMYRCRNRVKSGVCDGAGIAESKLDRLVVPKLAEIVRLRKESILDAASQESARSSAKQKSVTQLAKAVETERSRLLDAYVSGYVDKGLFENKMKGIEERQRQLEQLPGDDLAANELNEVLDVVEHIDEHWQLFTPQEKKGILQVITPRIVVYPSRQTSRAEIHTPLLDEVIVSEIWN